MKDFSFNQCKDAFLLLDYQTDENIGDYMYMGTKDGWHYMKNSITREYIYLHGDTGEIRR